MRTLYNILQEIWFLIFKLELKFNTISSEKRDVYDHLGLIDTLGWSKDTGKLIYSYSDELISISGFFLPFNYCLELQDSGSECKEIVFKKK